MSATTEGDTACQKVKIVELLLWVNCCQVHFVFSVWMVMDNSDDIQLVPAKGQQFKVTKFYLRIIQGVLPVDRRPVRQMLVHCSCLVFWLTVLIISLKSRVNCGLQSEDRT
jgi:hypothetical protein